MSHVRQEEIAPTHRKSSCRRGSHHYGPAGHVGAGIRRQVCVVCGSVTIDLTGFVESGRDQAQVVDLGR